MANKRDLKKQVRYICGDLAAECLIAAEYIDGINTEAMRNIVVEIALLQEHGLQNMSFAFDKVPSDFASRNEYNTARAKYFKTAFKAFRDKFNTRIQEIVKKMNAELPEAAKEANKQK